MKFIELDPSEEQIIKELRTLKPFERMEIMADQSGKPGVFITTRTSKAILVVGTMQYVK